MLPPPHFALSLRWDISCTFLISNPVVCTGARPCICYRLLQPLLSRQMLKCHWTTCSLFCRSWPLVNWLCFAGGKVASTGHLSLVDEAHMCAPYASWQGQRWAVTPALGGLWTGTRHCFTLAAAKTYKAGTDSTKIRHHGDTRQTRA